MTAKQAQAWLLKRGAQVNFSPAHGNQPATITVQIQGHVYRTPGSGRSLAAAIRSLRRQLAPAPGALGE